jgi:hypothetical protein
MIRKDSYAFPVAHENLTFADNAGLTKREYFAAMAMQGILANPNTSHQIESQYGKIDANNANKILAYTATKLSDALIKALNEIKP